MMGLNKLMLGVVVGAFGAWVFTSEAARDQLQRWSRASTAPAEQPLAGFVDNPVPDDVLAERDASVQAAAAAQREREMGA
jgi:hypothetical protein